MPVQQTRCGKIETSQVQVQVWEEHELVNMVDMISFYVGGIDGIMHISMRIRYFTERNDLDWFPSDPRDLRDLLRHNEYFLGKILDASEEFYTYLSQLHFMYIKVGDAPPFEIAVNDLENLGCYDCYVVTDRAPRDIFLDIQDYLMNPNPIY